MHTIVVAFAWVMFVQGKSAMSMVMASGGSSGKVPDKVTRVPPSVEPRLGFTDDSVGVSSDKYVKLYSP